MKELKTKMIFQNIMIGALKTLKVASQKYPNDYIIGYSLELENDIIKCEKEIKRLNSLIRVEKINKLCGYFNYLYFSL
jgi:hypothetical protein